MHGKDWALGVSLAAMNTLANAGFGGMGGVEEGSSGDLSDMVWGALIVGAIYLAWKRFF